MRRREIDPRFIKYTHPVRFGIVLTLVLLLAPLQPPSKKGDEMYAPGPQTLSRIDEAYGKLPLSFELANSESGRFTSRGTGYSLLLAPDEAVLRLRRLPPRTQRAAELSASRPEPAETAEAGSAVLRMKLLGARQDVRAEGADPLPGKSHYFFGNDPAKWRRDVPQFAKVRYHEVYDGIDLVYRGKQRQLEFDFEVAPGSDPNVIQLGFEGIDSLRIDSQGDLVLSTPAGEIHQYKPLVYQTIAAARKYVDGSYVINDRNRVGFELACYDTTQPLVIDPIVSYSTYLGGSDEDFGEGIAVDSAGNAYLTGHTRSTDFPTTTGAYDTSYPGASYAVFVTKLNPAGTALVYSTYIGGSTGVSQPSAIAGDSAGDAYVTGQTRASDFPTTAGVVQPTRNGTAGDTFVLKLNSTGSGLLYSTYLGGSDEDYGEGIAVDSAGNACVTGLAYSADFPLANAFQSAFGGWYDTFVAKINSTGTALVFSTYLGGTLDDSGRGVACDSAGNFYVTGSTGSNPFPTTPGSFQTSYPEGSSQAVFVTKFGATGAVVYSTYLHPGYGNGIAVDSAGNAHVTGSTDQSDLATSDAFQKVHAGLDDAFIAKLNPAGRALLYYTYLGGSGYDSGVGIALDSYGNAHVTGGTASLDFPLANAIQTTPGGDGDAFISRVNPTGTALVFSTFLGGSSSDHVYGLATDPAGNGYVVGNTQSPDFPTTPGSFQQIQHGRDAFVVKIARVSKVPGDFEASGKNNLAVYRPASGVWYLLSNTTPGSFAGTPWGAPGDLVVHGDYDGDGKTDIAVWRPGNGVWFVLPSNSTPGTYTAKQWGMSTDKPVPGDYDGDGKTDYAVWRPSDGIWYIIPSSAPSTLRSIQWGVSTDIPVPADFDGDGKADIAVWRPSSGTWHIMPSNSPSNYLAIQWGLPTDKMVPGDYDGDGRTDIAVWRPSSGIWYVLPSASPPGTFTSTQWGLSSDIPVSADYDGDGKTDIAVWRPSSGTWYTIKSTDPGNYSSTQWGIATDTPLSPLTRILGTLP